jgi:hypothetical protein
VYFSTDFNDVNERDPSVRTVWSDPCYPPGVLELETTYYWAVDEVNNLEDPNVWPSLIWDFETTDHITVDNFNSYADHAALRAVWKDIWLNPLGGKNGAEVFLETDPGLVRDGNSMRYYYRNFQMSGGKPVGSEAEADISALQSGSDWTVVGVKALVLYFQGDPANGQDAHASYTIANDRMWVAVEDGDAVPKTGIVRYDTEHGYDLNDVKEGYMHEWNIDLADPCLADVNMANIAKVYIGFGGVKGGATSKYGAGYTSGGDTVWFDDIQLLPPRCLTEKVATDFTGDCITDYEDVDVMGRDWLLSDGNASSVPPSLAPVAWYKFDEGTGTTALDSSVHGNHGTLEGGPQWVAGYDGNALDFDNIDDLVDINYIPELSLNDFTVSAWVNIDAEPLPHSGILGTRVGGDTTFDVKVQTDYIHGDIGDGNNWMDTAIDIRSFDTGTTGQGGNLALDTWYMITYVIDNTKQQVRMYIDGDLKRTIGISGIPLLMKPGQSMVIGNVGSWDEFMDGGQSIYAGTIACQHYRPRGEVLQEG